MTVFWLAAPEPMIRAAARHDYSKPGQPEITGYMLALQGEQDGDRYTIRPLAKMMGWGTTRARRIIALAKQNHEDTVKTGRVVATATLRLHPRDRAMTPATQSPQVQPTVSGTTATPPRQSDDTTATPSRAQSSSETEKVDQISNNAPDGAGIQEQDHEQAADPNHPAGLDHEGLEEPRTEREHAGGVPGDAPREVADGEGEPSAGGGVEAGGSDHASEAWSALCASVGAEWTLTAAWRKQLVDGAKSKGRYAIGGWDAWALIAKWVSEGGAGDGDAVFLRGRHDPETLIRPTKRQKWHNQAKDWAKQRGHAKPKNGKRIEELPLPPKAVLDDRLLTREINYGKVPKDEIERWRAEDRQNGWRVTA